MGRYTGSLAPGQHTITAVATDTAGNQKTSAPDHDQQVVGARDGKSKRRSEATMRGTGRESFPARFVDRRLDQRVQSASNESFFLFLRGDSSAVLKVESEETARFQAALPGARLVNVLVCVR